MVRVDGQLLAVATLVTDTQQDDQAVVAAALAEEPEPVGTVVPVLTRIRERREENVLDPDRSAVPCSLLRHVKSLLYTLLWFLLTFDSETNALVLKKNCRWVASKGLQRTQGSAQTREGGGACWTPLLLFTALLSVSLSFFLKSSSGLE